VHMPAADINRANPSQMETTMTRILTALVVALALTGAVSSAFAGPKSGPGECSTDEGYGRSSTCNQGGA
jgi:hypothetical protein